MDVSIKLAKLSAVLFYLNQLHKLNLVTPSIGRPFPYSENDVEKQIIHKAHRKIQQKRIKDLDEEIVKLKQNGTVVYWKCFLAEKIRFERKIEHLIQKFKPVPLNHRKSRSSKSSKIKNKRSRERYKLRQLKKNMKQSNCDMESIPVINLSSHQLSITETIALQMGSGFVPTPNNCDKEEETLILEGLRFIDRIGKVDRKLDDEKNGNEVASNATVSDGDYNISSSHHDVPEELFERNTNIPTSLLISQPQEPKLSHNITKSLKKEFDELNNQLQNNVRNKFRRKFNLPKKIRESLSNLKQLVKSKVLDIRAVDKGQAILVIDYSERKKAEELSVSKIATLCQNQSSNWRENKEFVESSMKSFFQTKFISKEELAAVTGLLAGGKCGKLKNKDGSIKFTRAIDSNELFSQQKTPYVYPLFKAHKLEFRNLLTIMPAEVATKIPSRLVVGMSSCQLSRIQAWLECFLTPLAKYYGTFEYIKDSTDMLIEIEKVKSVATEEEWNWDDFIIFTIDVKALYSSIKFEELKKSLHSCFRSCTTWNEDIIDKLIEIVIYTLENQQIVWNNQYYVLSQGIPTGGKHSCPLANIFMSFIFRDLLTSNNQFKELFIKCVKLWRRFIDDGGGIYKGGIIEFYEWYKVLKAHFQTYGLDLTFQTDAYEITENGEFVEKERKSINFLDIQIFKVNNEIHTCEFRKETSAKCYLQYNSAHPRHTFPGIIRSQASRLRRLCSRQVDYITAVKELEMRCLNSGYSKSMVNGILGQAINFERNLQIHNGSDSKTVNFHTIRLVVLAGTRYEHEFKSFAVRMNSVLKPHEIQIEIVKSTSCSIGQVLFNNFDKPSFQKMCNSPNCVICPNGISECNNSVISSMSGKSYKLNDNLNCDSGGVYVITSGCRQQYTGKTTTSFATRSNEHFYKDKSSTVYLHKQNCNECGNVKDFSINFIEHYHNRGKYTLSEREYLWNSRIKGFLNMNKTLRS